MTKMMVSQPWLENSPLKNILPKIKWHHVPLDDGDAFCLDFGLFEVTAINTKETSDKWHVYVSNQTLDQVYHELPESYKSANKAKKAAEALAKKLLNLLQK